MFVDIRYQSAVLVRCFFEYLLYGVLLFAEALGARTGCGNVSGAADSKRGRNRRMTGGLPEGSES